MDKKRVLIERAEVSGWKTEGGGPFEIKINIGSSGETVLEPGEKVIPESSAADLIEDMIRSVPSPGEFSKGGIIPPYSPQFEEGSLGHSKAVARCLEASKEAFEVVEAYQKSVVALVEAVSLFGCKKSPQPTSIFGHEVVKVDDLTPHPPKVPGPLEPPKPDKNRHENSLDALKRALNEFSKIFDSRGGLTWLRQSAPDTKESLRDKVADAIIEEFKGDFTEPKGTEMLEAGDWVRITKDYPSPSFHGVEGHLIQVHCGLGKVFYRMKTEGGLGFSLHRNEIELVTEGDGPKNPDEIEKGDYVRVSCYADGLEGVVTNTEKINDGEKVYCVKPERGRWLQLSRNEIELIRKGCQ